jgi:hypothetical protein
MALGASQNESTGRVLIVGTGGVTSLGMKVVEVIEVGDGDGSLEISGTG